ncbi:MAG TPA: DUF192 domain-containing protein [Flavobacteriaceae bacterium]|nr:DUF192 domain-containing protein [Flavobacteriaceae bacterium]
MKKNVYVLLFFVGFGIFSSCKNDSKQSIETPEITFTKEGELRFVEKEGDTVVVFAIEIAETDYEQQTGLMYRKSMEKDQGMLFIYPNERPRYGFYMKNTYFPLDLIYIDSENKIVDFNENTEPLNETPLPSKAPAKYVLEVNAGTVQNLGLELGDSVTFETNR